ncbi:MAG: hypothetical protein KAS23_17005 [Anaerohalosphaera sp.]|nr:hypothetical protein [Anaerohalosphaera sp.]
MESEHKKTGQTNDSMVQNQASHKEMRLLGEWAVKLCLDYGRSNIIIRQLHYFALRRKKLRKPDGSEYRNCQDDLFFLQIACRLARQMNLLPYGIFASDIGKGLAGRSSVTKPGSYHEDLNNAIDVFLVAYTRSMVRSILPVHVEVWLENSTAVNLLLPVAAKFNVDLLTYTADIPLNTIWLLIREFCKLDRPIVIFHFSDLVKYKDGFLVTAFDKLKAVICQYSLAEKIDIHFEHMMLTESQFCQFNLPLIPEGETCSGLLHSKVCELHALEAMCPGYIGSILDARLGEYINPDEIRKAKRIINFTYKLAYGRLSRCVGKGTSAHSVITALRCEMHDQYFGGKVIPGDSKS